MLTVKPPVPLSLVKIGRFRIVSPRGEAISQINQLDCEIYRQGEDIPLAGQWSYQIQANGYIDVLASQSVRDQIRQANGLGFWLHFVLSIEKYQVVVAQTRIGGLTWLTASNPATANGVDGDLFDLLIEVKPKTVAAQLSLHRTDEQPIDPHEYQLAIIAPTMLIGQPIGSMAVWCFTPLPDVKVVTVRVCSTMDQRVLAEVDLAVNMAKPINVWRITLG